MRSRHLFLLVYLSASCWGISSAQRNETCIAQGTCAQVPDQTSHFLQCVGLPPTDTGKDHMRRLKGLIEALLDVYTFMRSSMAGVPLLSLEAAMTFNPEADPFQDQALVQMWLEVKIKPLLSSISKQFLSCLSTKNFSCTTYQTVVKELSHHFSEMDPVRQKWIYMFFMYPFLSGEGVAGCVRPEEGSEDWLIRNFGSFSAMARIKDFSTLNMVFSGLEVLHLLTPEQKAELLLRPEVAGLDNGTLSLVFHSLMTGGQGPRPTPTPTPGQIHWTSPGYTHTYPPGPTYNPYLPPSPQDSLTEVVNGFMGAIRPIGSFVREFVSFTHERNISEIRSTTLTQALLNWTLAELASIYRPHNESVAPERETFDVTDVEDWYQHVVKPVLRRFLSDEQALMHENITLAFHHLFYLDYGMDNNTSGLQDICSITLDKDEGSCGLTNAVVNVAHVLHCIGRSNLTLSEETIMRMVAELTGRLNSLVKEFSTANFSEVASHFREVFREVESPSLTRENLEDPDFIKLWFQTKLLPLLPQIPTSLLSCLSTKNFTCPVYQTLVAELSKHMRHMDHDQMYSHMIYEHFIYPFLLHHNTSDPQCVSSANHSAEWLEKNFGFFSAFASVRDFYRLNPNFSGLEVLHLLSPKQTAELLVLPLPTPPEKEVVIHRVFDYLTEAPEERRFAEVLYHLVQLVKEVRPPCSVYQLIFERLYTAIPSLPPEIEPATWAHIDHLINVAPEDCLPGNITCPITQFNGTQICSGINSNELQHYLSTSVSMDVPCNFTLEKYACAQLENFTANHLVSLLRCNLPGNSSQSKVVWKMLLTKLSSVLDPALDILANMSMPMIGSSASEVLDVIGEMRLLVLSDEQLGDSSVIMKWFSGRLRGFLPSASGMFLHCLNSRNLSCHSYQQILQAFSHQFDHMTLRQQHLVLRELILPFLSHRQSDPGCVSSSNSSADWLQKNFGPFSVLVSLRDLLDLNPDFAPLEVLHLLSPKQTAEVLVLPLPTPPEKEVVIHRVFDYLTEAPEERRFLEVLYHLVQLVKEVRPPCSVYKLIFESLYGAIPSLPQEIEPATWAHIDHLINVAPEDCLPGNITCPITKFNGTQICSGINSNELQHYLSTSVSMDVPCNFTLEKYACAQLENFTANHLVSLLRCNLPGNSSQSKVVWKMLLTKLSSVLDPALDILANMSMPMIGSSASEVLDVIGEMRVLMLSDEQLGDSSIIMKWFSGRLRGFLPSASEMFLHCLNSRNLSCHSYQQILQAFSHQFDHMTLKQQHVVLRELILPFLTHRQSDPGCVSSSNSSADWLRKNLGPFSVFVSLRDLLDLNPDFAPLEVLHLLSSKQTAELLVLSLPTPPEKEVVIHRVFDYLTEAPEERRLPEVLHHLVQLVKEVPPPCGVYKLIFERLYGAIPSLPPEIKPGTRAHIDQLINIAPEDCLPGNITCPITKFNGTQICSGINSNELQHYLSTSVSMDVPCNFTLEKYACAQLENFTANHLVSLLRCNLPGNSSQSKVVWKMLLTKLSSVLDPALDILANMSMPMIGSSASEVLDVIGEMRVLMLSDEQLGDSSVIMKWFYGRLRGFLPSASGMFLHCLNSRNLSCHSYQQILQAFSHQFDHMTLKQQHLVLRELILPFLTHRQSDPGCVSSSNSSADWLRKNLGPFSVFVSLRDLLDLNPDFAPLENLRLLSPKQTAELLVLSLPTPPEKEVVIHRVFDYLTEAPEERRLPEVLHHLVQLVKEVPPPCGVYKLIFERLYGAIPSLPPEIKPGTRAHIDQLINIAPEDCLPGNITCPITKFNGTQICSGINSNELQHYLSTLVSMDVPCNFTLEKYACAQLENFTANHLVSLLRCNLPGNSSQSKVVWKMLLTKLSSVLDPALDILANMSMPMIGSSASEVLDVIGEMRVLMLSDEQLGDSSVIMKWFSGRLRGFLPSASEMFLHCLNSRNLSCHSYQKILQAFSHQFDHMTLRQQHLILSELILPFLSHRQSDPGCVSSSNSSAEWLRKNLGPFSVLVSLRDLLDLNPDFAPLEVLRLLSPKQTAELLVLPLSTLPGKEVLINVLFDYLTESPEERRFAEFLSHLVMFSQEGNISCSSYKILFSRLDLAMPVVHLDIASSITNSKLALSKHIPPGCIIYSRECNVTPTNETDICIQVNSTALQLRLDNGQMNGRFCDFGIKEYACASLSALTAEDLAAVLKCNRSSNSSGSRPVWKLFLSKASVVLDAALDLLANMTFDPSDPAVSLVLDSIREIRLDSFNTANFQDPAFIQLWFNRRLRPFLPAVSTDFLSCLTTKNLTCSTYQDIVQILSRHRSSMKFSRQIAVYTYFIKVFLTRNLTADPSCSSHNPNSGEWLEKNLGGFSALVSFDDLQRLYSNFSAVEALPQLTVRQLAEVSSTPGQLTTPAQVTMVMGHVPNQLFTAFFDDFSAAITGHESQFPSEVRSAMLQVVFDRANLSSPSVGDQEVLGWLHNRLRPLLVNLSPLHVAPFFKIVAGRNCSTEQQAVEVLHSTRSMLGDVTQEEIHNHIIQSLRGPIPLRCYGDNYNHSFYGFLERSFMGFQFPNLTTFLSLMPNNNMHQLVNSMPPSDLGNFLRRRDIVDDDAKLCLIYNNYDRTPIFLETEALPEVVRRPTLPCVWPTALSSTKRSEVNAWFDRRLQHYLVFLTKSLLTSTATHNASCLAFQKLVSVLGNHNYSAADFVERDVFNTIKAYLTSAKAPKCYNANDPELNSTAWFAEYIGSFMYFLTLEDLNTFGSAQFIQVFTVNPLNIALLNHSLLPLNLTNYYTELIYLQDSNFNPMLLPLLCRCVAPGPAFSQLTGAQSVIILHNLTTHCTDLDPQVSAALAGNLGDNIDTTSIAALGSESTGMSTGQINMVKPGDLHASLGILSTVIGWNQGQAMAIIQSLMSSGMIQLNNASSLLMVGSLVVGVPASTFLSISGSQLLTASKDPGFLTHLIIAPQIVQQTFVTQIISVNSSSDGIIENVPDELATQIPRSLLLGFSQSDVTVINTLNKKKWKRQQAVLFFDIVAGEIGTSALGNPNNLSSYVLQGFTCTKVTTLRRTQIKELIKACRRTGKQKVILLETQLTCMYNYIKEESDATSYSLYPPDMLLFYDYSLVSQATCRSYFQELADADFSIFSSALSYKRSALFTNAKSCLGITSTSLTEDNVSVLGNMCCTLDASYIENSHSSILEKLKNCADLTDAQVAAVQTLLLGGTTTYGAPSTWDGQTLEDLGILPLYLTETFYDEFDKKTKRTFLKSFLKVLRSNGVERSKKRKMKQAIRRSIKKVSKRSIASECTVGEITQVTISDETFPFDYDNEAQFNCCLSAKTVKDNLAAITTKVDQEVFLVIVLNKLREYYAAHSTIPEDKVQVLGPASRLATNDDINMWNITKIDTLSALMDSSDGQWDRSMAKAVISKYLSKEGNSLGSAELNSIGGANLCSLDATVLKTISQDSLRTADALTLSNCTLEQKRELFTIARQAFSGNTRSAISANTYQLIQPYMGGATADYTKSLAASNISMDMATFTSLDETVILSLNVNEVQGLLGSNLAELKSYENQTVVQSWISRQSQTDLDRLGLALVGGRVDSSTTAASTVTVTPGSSSSTTAAGSTVTVTPGSSSSTTAAGSTVTVTPGSSSSTTAAGSTVTVTPGSSSSTTAAGSTVTATTGSSSSTTTAGSGSSSTTGGSATTTGSSGARIRADAGLSLLVLLAVFIASHILH